jgi:hypothetical protein
MNEDKNFCGKTYPNTQSWGNYCDVVTGYWNCHERSEKNLLLTYVVGFYGWMCSISCRVPHVPEANSVFSAAVVKSTMMIGRCQIHDRLSFQTTNTNTLVSEKNGFVFEMRIVYKDYNGLSIRPDWNCYERKYYFACSKLWGRDSTQA